MHLNHLNLGTSDVGRLTGFFTRHFGFQQLAAPSEDFAILRGDGSFILNLMKPGRAPVGYPGGFHVGFLVATPDVVRAKHDELTKADWTPGPVKDLDRGGFASTTFYCKLPDGIMVEVGCPR